MTLFRFILVLVLISCNNSVHSLTINPQQDHQQRVTRTLLIDPRQIALAPGSPLKCYNNQDPASSSSHICLVPSQQVQNVNFHTALFAAAAATHPAPPNPLLDTLLLSSSVGLHQKIPGFNHFDHLPLNPYLALLLSHYGKYTPIYGQGRGIYGYNAANNFHNNKPFGSYKIYEDI